MWCSNTLNLARIRSIVKVSSFPHYKELRDFDFEFQTSIKPEIRDFETLRFLEAAENIVFLGSSGVGENTSGHFHRYNCRQEAIQHLLHKVPWSDTAAEESKTEKMAGNPAKALFKYKLLSIDELGYLPIEKDDWKLFFQLIDLRGEKQSTILTTNINFNFWDDVFHAPVIANAILDRILHHVHVINITEKSYQLREYMTQDNE